MGSRKENSINGLLAIRLELSLVEANVGVSRVLVTFTGLLQLQRTGKRSANIEAEVSGCWDDLLAIVLGKTNLSGRDNVVGSGVETARHQ